MRTPHSSRPRSAREHPLQRRQPAAHVLASRLVAGKQGEQFQRNDRRAAEEKLDDRGVRERMPGDGLDVLKLLLQRVGSEAIERRVRDDSPDVPINREESRSACARNAGRAHRAAEGAFVA